MLTPSHQNRLALELRRRKAAKLFNKNLPQAEIARKLKVSREAVSQWHEIWKKKGLNGLKSAGKPGPKPRLTFEKLKKIEKALIKGPSAFGFATQIWTLARISAMIKKTFKVQYGATRVWQILRLMNWTCQKPETRASERNEKAIQHWIKNIWPRIKKKREKLARN